MVQVPGLGILSARHIGKHAHGFLDSCCATYTTNKNENEFRDLLTTPSLYVRVADERSLSVIVISRAFVCQIAPLVFQSLQRHILLSGSTYKKYCETTFGIPPRKRHSILACTCLSVIFHSKRNFIDSEEISRTRMSRGVTIKTRSVTQSNKKTSLVVSHPKQTGFGVKDVFVRLIQSLTK